MSATSFNGGALFEANSFRGHGMATWALKDFRAYKGLYHASKSKKDFEAYMRRILPQGAFMIDSSFREEDEVLAFELEVVFKKVRLWATALVSPKERIFKITGWEGEFDPNATK